MPRRTPVLPLWRACGAGLGVMALVFHVLLAAIPIMPAGAADSAFSVVCSHDGLGAAGGDDPGPNPHSDHHCAVCACPLHGGLLGPPRATAIAVAFLAPKPVAVLTAPQHASERLFAPYASRAPPPSA